MTVKAVAERPKPFVIDDEFAKSLGVESLDRAEGDDPRRGSRADYARASREKVKRKLLDALDGALFLRIAGGAGQPGVRLDLGAGQREQQASGRSFADENTTEEAARAEYRNIAERRVSLGLAACRSRRQGGRQGHATRR